MNAGAFIGALVAACALALAAACGSDGPSRPSPPAASAGPLPAGVVARVGSADVYATTVGRITAAQSVDRERAADLAVREALFASEARARSLDNVPSLQSAVQAALARVLLRQLYADAKAKGDVTEDELHDATQFHWLDMDRPPGARTVHAVVRLNAKADAARRKSALALADAIRKALEPIAARASSLPAPAAPSSEITDARAEPPAPDPLIEAFKQTATAVPNEGFEVVVESLPAVAVDGRVLEPGGSVFAVDFARAAAALTHRGELSPPVTSEFGVHVIMLIERTPPRSIPANERRALLHDEIIVARARGAQRAILERARASAAIERGVDALLAQVSVDQ